MNKKKTMKKYCVLFIVKYLDIQHKRKVEKKGPRCDVSTRITIIPCTIVSRALMCRKLRSLNLILMLETKPCEGGWVVGGVTKQP